MFLFGNLEGYVADKYQKGSEYYFGIMVDDSILNITVSEENYFTHDVGDEVKIRFYG